MFINTRPKTSTVLSAAPGSAGARQTMEMMRTFTRAYRIDPSIRALAVSIIHPVEAKDTRGEICALFEWVQSNIRYTSDVLDVETLATPSSILETRAGDCDDMSTLLATLLESVGIRTRFVLAGYNHPGVFEHVFTQAFDGLEWVSLDPTEPLIAGQEPAPTLARYTERI